MYRFRTLLLLVTLFISSGALASDYIFGWPFIEPAEMQPRGGTTTGPDVQLDDQTSADFQRIQESGISDFERDRRAILAMAGPYRVSFDFLEVTGFQPGFQPAAPYKSWGTEYVYVLADEGEYISLQHVLVMSIVDDEGNTHGPFTTKHWRQDWNFQPREVHRYQGKNTWARQAIDAAQSEGYWAQTVWQVDDSPRYAGWGQWQHTQAYSTWRSNETWRPLPRREYSVRDDYDVLVGRNQHTIIADGWIQEDHNHKVVLEAVNKESARLAREYGIARYQRISDYDFSPGDAYMASTLEFWHEVRQYWDRLFRERDIVHLRAPVDQAGLFRPLFARAQAIADGEAYDPDSDPVFIQNTINDFLAGAPSPDPGY